MKRKKSKQLFSKIAIVGLIGILLVNCKEVKPTKVETKVKRPNIIYILADDLGYGDLSINGQQKFSTPNIDDLAKKGMLFTQHYSGSTVCAPSRSALMTGLHTGHTFIRGNKEIMPEGQHPLESSTVTVAKLLKQSGYITGAFGKWGLGFPGSEGDPNKQGFDTFYGYNCQRLGHNYYPYYLWDNQTKVMLNNNQGKLKGTYAPNVIHDEALSFLEKNKDTTFFMYYPSVIPHAELVAPEKYMEKYRGKFLPEKEYERSDTDDEYRNGDYDSQTEPHAAFVAMIHLLDEQVGEIKSKIEELGIADNTLIIFTSDNGPHLEGGADPDYFDSNASFRGYKRDLYEGGIRVPLIAYWPNKIAKASTTNHISAFWDFLPTVCDLVNIDAPENIDGISYLPELLGKEQKKHDFLYWEFHELKGKQAVRYGDWKGVRLNIEENDDAPIELYNLSTDIAEQNDVAAEFPEISEKIKEIMKNEHVYSKEFNYQYEQQK